MPALLVNLLRSVRPGVATTHSDDADDAEGEPCEPRRLLPARDDALPLYVQAGGTRVGKSGDELTMQPRDGEPQMVRLGQTSQVALFGQVQMSTQAIHAALGRAIPISYFTSGSARP